MVKPQRTWLAALTGLTLLVSACAGSTSAGPTCSEFLAMSDAEKHDAVIEWAVEHDGRIDPDNPEAGQGGFALFSDYANLSMYCGAPGHDEDHLGNVVPVQ